MQIVLLVAGIICLFLPGQLYTGLDRAAFGGSTGGGRRGIDCNMGRLAASHEQPGIGPAGHESAQ